MQKRKLTIWTSHSEVDTFRKCPAKWGYRYPEGLRPPISSVHLRLGSAYHRGLDAGWTQVRKLQQEGETEWREMTRSGITSDSIMAMGAALTEQETKARERAQAAGIPFDLDEDPDEMFDLLRSMISIYWRLAWDLVGKYDVELVEEKFEMSVAYGVKFRGVIDLLLRCRLTGDLVVVEHKTTTSAPMDIEDRFGFDPQANAYLYAVQQMIKKGKLKPGAVGRVQYHVARKKIPSSPTVKKDGMVSTAAIDTLAEVYAEALAKQVPSTERQQKAAAAYDEKPTDRNLERLEKANNAYAETRADQERILGQLHGRGLGAFVGSYECSFSEGQVQLWREEMSAVAKRLRAAHKGIRDRNPGHCTAPGSGECEYRPICVEDPKYQNQVKTTRFVKREPRKENDAQANTNS